MFLGKRQGKVTKSLITNNKIVSLVIAMMVAMVAAMFIGISKALGKMEMPDSITFRELIVVRKLWKVS